MCVHAGIRRDRDYLQKEVGWREGGGIGGEGNK